MYNYNYKLEKMIQAQIYFSDCWFEEDAFKIWLSKAADKKQTRCR